MTTLEYMTKKNELVKRVTGKTLIPEGQLVEVKLSNNFKPNIVLAASNCPYCLIYEDSDKECEGCIMNIANNRCGVHIHNTWEVCSSLWEGKATDKNKDELYNLGIELIYSQNKGE